ncbi:hypothetical protein [uncultured Clostridium sp.]|uniref:hypothetical protein n=1 Tax=uncultured Clostridium sp. TaxID=59620 RepID=UPI0025EA1CC5|nr:hypothetical protein [uncultured Clostridium sp.]MDU4884319.1 hypothetical protein [Clostridium celatum]MDU7077481.1 hypothetical protein [Clostridium celatum]
MLIDIKEIKDLKEAEIIKRLISIGAITKIGKSYEILAFSDYESEVKIGNGTIYISKNLLDTIS